MQLLCFILDEISVISIPLLHDNNYPVRDSQYDLISNVL